MKQRCYWVPALLALALTVLALTGCGPQGEDGTSYLALDWVYTPLAIDFPELPAVVIADTYYPHPAGLYHGEYVAWDGTWWTFNYQIEVNPGEWGMAGLPGEDGADRFYSMILHSWGPELSFVDLTQSLSLAQQPPAARRLEAGAIDAGKYDLEHPTPYRYERTGPGYRFVIEGRSYQPLR